MKIEKSYTVIVYDSFSHWGKPIPELEETFSTFWEAELYGEYITSVKPDYYIQIENYDLKSRTLWQIHNS